MDGSRGWRWAVLSACVAATTAGAAGRQLNEYEPTPAGETFFAVDAPWYRNTRLLSVGLTLDLAHDPLVGGTYDAQGHFTQTLAVVSTQLVGHLDVAVAPLDWLLVSASLPVTLHEAGTPAFGVTPLEGVAVGDPRLGVDARVWGDDRTPLSLHVGGRLWIPVGAEGNHAGDADPRGLLQAMAGGRVGERVQWAGTAGVLLRHHASLTDFDDGLGATGSELRLSGGVAYVDEARHFDVSGEALFGSGLGSGETFAKSSVHFGLLVGAGYTFADLIKVGPAVELGLVRDDGAPKWRGLLRIAYAPTTPQKVTAERPADRDDDGVIDADDLCPDTAAGERPDPNRPGCPAPQPVSPAPETAPVPETAPAPTSQPTPEPTPAPESSPAPEAAPPSSSKPPPTEAPPTEATPAPTPAPETTLVWTVPSHPLPEGCREATPYPDGARLLTARFELDSAGMTDADRNAVRRLAKALRAFPSLRIEVDGFTDDLGADAYNQALSLKRAQAVADTLIAGGVRPSRIDVQGLGNSQPVCSGTTLPERAANRRADVRLIR